MLVHYGRLWGKNKKINMEWRGSQHAVSVEAPGKCGKALHRPFLWAPSMALSSALLKKWVVDLVLKEGGQE